jgi:hypothetical protein
MDDSEDNKKSTTERNLSTLGEKIIILYFERLSYFLRKVEKDRTDLFPEYILRLLN